MVQNLAKRTASNCVPACNVGCCGSKSAVFDTFAYVLASGRTCPKTTKKLGMQVRPGGTPYGSSTPRGRAYLLLPRDAVGYTWTQFVEVCNNRHVSASRLVGRSWKGTP
jgi:hypothetical protein